jgi:hypothetical protein
VSKKSPSTVEPQSLRGWVAIQTAASYLDMSPDALRRTFERRSVRAPDGGVEANIDGVRARKFGRIWRVAFAERWLRTEGA